VPLIVLFFSFCSAISFGRQSATAAHITSASQSARASSTAASISAALVTRVNAAPSGGPSDTGPEISRTACPRATPASARA